MGGDAREGDLSAGGSPRGATGLDALDIALRYYEVLQEEGPPARRPTLQQTLQPIDDYDQVTFAEQNGATQRGHKMARAGSMPHITNTVVRLRAARSDIQGRAVERIQRITGRFQKRYTKLRQPIAWTPKRVLLRDKVVFLLGVAHLAVSAFWLGKSPSTFYKLYTVKAILLFSLRLIIYRRTKMHYYLFDFCYYANVLMILHTWALPESCALAKTMFAFSMGPLAWSIIAFRNSMIFHSLDKMTSVFLHAFPPLVAWSQRWYPGDANHWKLIPSKECKDKARADVWELIVIPWIPYVLWAVAYYLKIFVVSSSKIQERGYHTLFQYVTRKPKSLFGQLFRVLPRWLSPIVFMLWHVAFCAVTFVLSWLMWQSFWLNTGFIIAMLSCSAWNGGNYYFHVFAKRYLTDTGMDLDQKRYTDAVLNSQQSKEDNEFMSAPDVPHVSAGNLEDYRAAEDETTLIERRAQSLDVATTAQTANSW